MSFPLLPSFKPQVRLIPQIASQVANYGTIALLGTAGATSAVQNGFIAGDSSPMGLLQTAIGIAGIAIPATTVAWLNKTGSFNLLTRVFWKKIQDERLEDKRQEYTKAVVNSDELKAHVNQVVPHTTEKYDGDVTHERNSMVTSGLLYGLPGVALTVASLVGAAHYFQFI